MFSSEFSSETIQAEHSGKMQVVSLLLQLMKAHTTDKVVLVSHSTKTLDIFEKLFENFDYSFLRLDGKTDNSKRQKLVDQFNQKEDNHFIFLLSTKAGGVGLNLIGANRLIMYDCDWNPAIDEQAMARVWRDGQPKNVWIYRLFSTGSIEEKIYQRQLEKYSLSENVFSSSKKKENKNRDFRIFNRRPQRPFLTCRKYAIKYARFIGLCEMWLSQKADQNTQISKSI